MPNSGNSLSSKRFKSRISRSINLHQSKLNGKKTARKIRANRNRKRRNRKPREGAGNRPKNLVPNSEETATVDTCDLCGKDLSAQAPLESTNERIIEDIVEPPEQTLVTLVSQEKKYCADCQEVITAKSDLALPGADIGINATVLVVDGWNAYLYLLCEQQSCLSHLLRKVRKFRDAFPHLADIVKFYLKFRRIIRDGERLQQNRDQLGELVFQRRLKRLKQRLADLLQWPNPDNILEEIIKKVKRQQPRILTFVEHPDVPFHNNYAEYLIRIGVLKRKISGGSVSAEGAQAYAILLSIYTTCKLRGISFPQFLKQSLKHYIKTGKPQSLKSYQDATVVVPEVKKAA